MIVRCTNVLDYYSILGHLKDEYNLSGACERIRGTQPYYFQVKGIRITIQKGTKSIILSICYAADPSTSISCAEFIFMNKDDVINQIVFDEAL